MFNFAILASVLATSDPVQMAKVAQADLTQASIAIDDVERCAAKSAHWEPSYDALSAKLFEEQERVEGLLGAGVEPSLETVMAAEPALAPRCSDDFVKGASLRATAAFLGVERLADRLEAPMSKGLWFGLFPVCARTVQSAELILSPDTGAPAVMFKFKPENAEELNSYSGRFLSENIITIRLKIRLDGRVIASPRMYVPIKTAIMLTGLSSSEAKAVVSAAALTCATP